jgi:hypothetical protein
MFALFVCLFGEELLPCEQSVLYILHQHSNSQIRPGFYVAVTHLSNAMSLFRFALLPVGC